MRQIIEKAKKRKVNLHFNFIDFKSAFATIWREALWEMLAHIGINKKIIKILEKLYENSNVQLQLTENWLSGSVY